MDQLIISMLQGRASPEEIARVRRWRRRSRENEARFRELEEIWKSMGEEGATPFSRPAPDPDALIRRVEAGSSRFAGEPKHDGDSFRTLDEEVRTAPGTAGTAGAGGTVERGRDGSRSEDVVGIEGRRERFRKWVPLSAAAAVLVAVGVGVSQLDSVLNGPAPATSSSEITTGPGEMTTIQIPDGTSIRLGPRSTLRLSLDGDSRSAWLEQGRAFFGVARDSSREFTVHTPMGEALVLGTRFEVRAEEEEFRVLVVEGKVSVTAGGSSLELGESQMSRTREGSPQRTLEITDVYKHLSWLGNSLVFQMTPLPKALEEIERRYGIEMHLDDPSLAQHRVTATFTNDEIEEVITVLCEIIGAHCSVEGDDRVRIGSAAPASTALAH